MTPWTLLKKIVEAGYSKTAALMRIFGEQT
jgi:hypothetical protein